VLPVPSTKPYLAAMLRASLVSWVLVAVVPAYVAAASSAAAVAAAVSAAPCIVRFVRYQLATSVPSPAKPTIAERQAQ
jgi:tetrahydromethanopterin S-methyltransferase subunit C